MHDRKLLSDSELNGAGTELATQATKRAATRANFWAIVGFCVTGLVCSMYVPASYLNAEQTAALLIKAALG